MYDYHVLSENAPVHVYAIIRRCFLCQCRCVVYLLNWLYIQNVWLYRYIRFFNLWLGRRWTGGENGEEYGMMEGWMRSVRCGSLVGFLSWCNCSLWLFHHWLFIRCGVWNLIDISGRRRGAHLGLRRSKWSQVGLTQTKTPAGFIILVVPHL